MIGLTQAAAEAKIIAADLTVGQVTAEFVASLGSPLIRSARAQVSCLSLPVVDGIVFDQSPCPTDVTGILVAQGTSVSFVIGVAAAAIPEPSSLALFAMGLGLLIVITMWRRRRSCPR